jgi:hypothetical protein
MLAKLEVVVGGGADLQRPEGSANFQEISKSLRH